MYAMCDSAGHRATFLLSICSIGGCNFAGSSTHGYLQKCCWKCYTQTSLMAKPLTSVRLVGWALICKTCFLTNNSQIDSHCHTYSRRRDKYHVGNSVTILLIQVLQYLCCVQYAHFLYAWNCRMTSYIWQNMLYASINISCVPNYVLYQRSPTRSTDLQSLTATLIKYTQTC